MKDKTDVVAVADSAVEVAVAVVVIAETAGDLVFAPNPITRIFISDFYTLFILYCDNTTVYKSLFLFSIQYCIIFRDIKVR